MKRLIWALLGVVGLLLLAGGYVGLRAAQELERAQRAIADADAGTTGNVKVARAHLRNASDILNGPAADVLRWLPVARQNVGAMRTVASGLDEALEPAEALADELERLREGNIIEDGRIDVGRVRRIRGPLGVQGEALAGLTEDLENERSGWLLPPVYDALTELIERTTRFGENAMNAAAVLERLDPLVGVGRARRYLVVFMNNAELRGAGGIASAIGHVTFDDGRVDMGPMHYHGDIDDPRPFRRVAAPPDFRRRFSPYKADTTLWTNLTFSSDVPEVALVGSRLYELVKDVRTHGAFVVDPVGLSALLPPDKQIAIPSLGETIEARDLPRFVYSDAYEQLGGGDPERRGALLEAGTSAIDALLDGGLSLGRLIDASGSLGGHVRFVSFDEEEQRPLTALGVTGKLEPPEVDVSLVSSQNFAPNKLDYWVEREFRHACAIDEARATCRTETRLDNRAPEGLSPFVEGRARKNYALSVNLIETYIPEGALVTGVQVDGHDAEYFPEPEDGMVSVAVEVTVPKGEERTVNVDYELPIEGRYELEMRPQPLARPARVSVILDAPAGWVARGPGAEGGDVAFEGTFDSSLSFTAASPDRPGLSGLWDGLRNFWNEPLFD